MKILVVEDTRSTLAIISAIVQRLGATVTPVESGHDALDAFKKEKPDIILLDVILPDISGLEVARRIREAEPLSEWTPIIFLSSRTDEADLEKGIMAGGDDYLYKPVSEVVLSAKLRAMQRIIQMRTSLVVLTRQLDATNQELKRLSALDGLTGIANRRYFDQTLASEWRRGRRNATPLALLMCDVDHFKQFNDSYGHQQGDDCLRQVAKALSSHLDRTADTAARYGGEEFAILLPETALSGGQLVACRLQSHVADLNIPHIMPPGRISLSIGVATLIPNESSTPEMLVSMADQALYQAKAAGRNRVVVQKGE